MNVSMFKIWQIKLIFRRDVDKGSRISWGLSSHALEQDEVFYLWEFCLYFVLKDCDQQKNVSMFKIWQIKLIIQRDVDKGSRISRGWSSHALEKDEVCCLSKREFCLYFGFWVLKDCDQQKKNWWVKWWMIRCLKYDKSTLSFRGMSTRVVVFREADHHMPWRHRSFRSVHHSSSVVHRLTVSSMFPLFWLVVCWLSWVRFWILAV